MLVRRRVRFIRFLLQCERYAAFRILINRALQVDFIHGDCAFASVFYYEVQLIISEPVVIYRMHCAVFQIEQNGRYGGGVFSWVRIRRRSAFLPLRGRILYIANL